MTKLYIHPQTIVQKLNFISSVCVGSFHGDAGLEYGGQSDGSVKPM